MAAAYQSFKEVVKSVRESNKYLERMTDSMDVLKTEIVAALKGVLSAPASSIPSQATASEGFLASWFRPRATASGGSSASSIPSQATASEGVLSAPASSIPSQATASDGSRGRTVSAKSQSVNLTGSTAGLVKGASIDLILKTFPKILSGAKSGFKKLGSAVKLLDDESFQKGADNLLKISDALTKFGDLNYAKLFVATKFFPSFVKSLQKMSQGLDVASIKKDLEPLSEISTLLAGKEADKKIKASEGILGKLVRVLTGFADIDWASIVGSTVALTVFAKGIKSASKLFNDPALVQGIKSLEPAMDAMLGITQKMSKIGESFGKALGSFFGEIGKNLGKIAKGALAIGLLSASLFVASMAFSAFGDVSWDSVLKGVVALGALTLAALALGTIMASGVGAVAIFLGAAAIAALGAALIPAAIAMQMAGQGMMLIGEGLSLIVPQLVELASVTPMLYATAGAIVALSAALALFGAGSAVAGIGALFGKLTGGSPIKQLRELADMGEGLQNTADALDRIRGSNATATSGKLNNEVATSDIVSSEATVDNAVSQARGKNGGDVVMNAPSSNTSNTSNFFSSSWVPDRTSLFVLAGA